MTDQIKEIIRVLKYLKSLKGKHSSFIKHTNSSDIKSISQCCYNLLVGNIPLTPKEKKFIRNLLSPNIEEIKILARKNTSIKKKRNVLSTNQVGSGIISLLVTTLLPILISSIVKK